MQTTLGEAHISKTVLGDADEIDSPCSSVGKKAH
jgi:hypothetical protein